MISKIVSQLSARIRSVGANPPAAPFRFGDYLQLRLQEEEGAGVAAAFPSRTAAPVPLLHEWRTRLLQNQRVGMLVRIFVLPAQRSEAEQKVFVELKRASLGLGLGTLGLFFFPLQLAGLVCLFPTIADVFKRAGRHLWKEQRITGEVLNAALLAGALAGGFFYTLIFGGWALVLVRWLAIKTEDHSRQEITDLFGRQTRTVWMVIDDTEIEMPLEQVQVGDHIQLDAGQTAPVDGLILKGFALLDQHMLTGEAQPVEKGPGDRVLAATVVLAGSLTVQVEKAGTATTAAQIGRILTDTSNFKESLVSRATEFNDRVALPFLLLGGVSTLGLGLSGGLAVLQVAPGYRMTLYGPLSLLSFLHLAARTGILIKDGRSLELLREVDTVLFDKTGTLTPEQPQVHAIHCCAGFSEEDVLTWAAAAETKQQHPIARAILAAAAARGIVTNAVTEGEYQIGFGVTVRYVGQTVRVGSARFLGLHHLALPPALAALQTEVNAAAHSLVLVAVNDTVVGAIVLHPAIRPEAQAIVRALQARGMQLYVVSGDHEAPTRRLAEELNMQGYFAAVLPEGKADVVRQLQKQGRKVCFVGDGINDSIALKIANVSISLQGATTIATDTAQIVLMEGDLQQLPQVFTLADEFASNMRVNFLAATVPCFVILGGIYLLGWGLLPATILYQVSVPFALHNTLRPLLTQQPPQGPPGGP